MEGKTPSQKVVPPSVNQSIPLSRPWQGWFSNWVFWAGLAALASASLGFGSVVVMLKLPSAPNCPSIFWPLASASVRLHCAQIAASKQNVDDLLEAIALVKPLPNDHPLREEINSHIEEWSVDILNLSEESFQAGKLDEAIAIARKIPSDLSSYKSVESKITQWQSIWSQAEEIYQEAESQMREARWRLASSAAVRLLNVKNEYWQTTKYDELNYKIETAKEDGNKLAKAKNLASSGSAPNSAQAIKLLETIASDSYIYQDAQDLISELGRKMLDSAKQALDRKDASQALDIANQIPASANLQAEVEDFTTLAEAWRSAWIGTTFSLQGAIAIAQGIKPERPTYTEAQDLIRRWQLEIQDVTHLEKARELAQKGSIQDLTAAIKEVQIIPDTNPRAEEANEESDRWRRQIETIEDRPYLNRAEEIAASAGEDINLLQMAIDEANRIGQGRALHRESRRKVRSWTRQIQRIQDQPLLDEAKAIADTGDLPAAIAAAQRIQSGRALSREAQASIEDWQGQIRATENWQRARQLARQGTPDALAEAIRLANRVPVDSLLRSDVNISISDWSQQILGLAVSRSNYDVPGAIEIARQVPSGTDAYQTAQEQIKTWEELLTPTPTPSNEPEQEQQGQEQQQEQPQPEQQGQ